MPELVRDGVLVTGDAAGLCVNLGFTVRGMDFAVESGRLAAEAVIKAHELGDFSAAVLSSYQQALEYSFVMRDLKSFKGFPTLLSRRAIFECLPGSAGKSRTRSSPWTARPARISSCTSLTPLHAGPALRS